MKSLSKLEMGKKAVVIRLYVREDKKRRFYDLGVIPGMVLEALFKSPLGDPVAYDINGSVIALRKEDTSLIEVCDE